MPKKGALSTSIKLARTHISLKELSNKLSSLTDYITKTLQEVDNTLNHYDHDNIYGGEYLRLAILNTSRFLSNSITPESISSLFQRFFIENNISIPEGISINTRSIQYLIKMNHKYQDSVIPRVPSTIPFYSFLSQNLTNFIPENKFFIR